MKQGQEGNLRQESEGEEEAVDKYREDKNGEQPALEQWIQKWVADEVDEAFERV